MPSHTIHPPTQPDLSALVAFGVALLLLSVGLAILLVLRSSRAEQQQATLMRRHLATRLAPPSIPLTALPGESLHQTLPPLGQGRYWIANE